MHVRLRPPDPPFGWVAGGAPFAAVDGRPVALSIVLEAKINNVVVRRREVGSRLKAQGYVISTEGWASEIRTRRGLTS